MKNIKYIIIILAFSIQLFGQNKSIRIDLNNVDLAGESLISDSYKSAIEKRVKYELESFDFSKASDSLVYTNLHPMVAALHFSFADHRSVIISPDMIWLLINQSFAIHINQNPEKYRDLIVGFQDKKTVKVFRDDFKKGSLTNPWHEVFPTFSDSIKKYIGDSLHKTLVPSFSTTGIAEKSAFEISLMDATSNYFDYEFITLCGIPYIVLQGEPTDWKWILDNLDFFNKFGLEFWTDRLKPIVEELYKSSNGTHNINFWRSIYKWHQASGGNLINGWITDFFLYMNKSDKYIFNDLLFKNQDWLLIQPKELENEPHGFHGNEFPSGLSKVDFTWYYGDINTDTFKMCIYAGFVGISQDVNSLELKPEISYAIVDKESTRLDSDNSTIIDNHQPSCNSYLYDAKGINQLPVFKPDINHNNHRKSEVSFEKYIKEKVAENYPSRKSQKHFKIFFTVTITGEIKDIFIETLSDDESFIDFIKKLVNETGEWKPAVINGEKADYRLKAELWI